MGDLLAVLALLLFGLGALALVGYSALCSLGAWPESTDQED